MDQKQLRKKTPEQMVEAIFALDLDPIKVKLMDKKEGHGWSRAKVDAVELEYRRFLALTAKYPNEAITPDTDVDKFWHCHILDTMKYAQDCQEALGYFLHHFPYFGMRDEEDAVNLSMAAVNTKTLYEREFGAVADNGGPRPYCCVVSDTYHDAATAGKQADAGNGGPRPYCCVVSDTYHDAVTAGKQADAGNGGPRPYCCVVSDTYHDAATAGKQADAGNGGPRPYCCVVSDMYQGAATAGKQANNAYFGVDGRDVVTGKGRPKLQAESVM